MADPSRLPTTFTGWQGRIWNLTWPVILANITIPLVGVADVAVMGRFTDPAYLAAVGVGAAMFSAIYWMFGFLRMGTTGLVAQAFGANNYDRLFADVFRAAAVAVVLALLVLCLQLPLQWLLFAIFNETSGSVLVLVEEYFTIRIWGAPGLLIYLVTLGTLFGLQRMRETLFVSVGFNLTNLVLDVYLALYLDMGVRGVALGTAISEWLAAMIGIVFVWRTAKALGVQIPNLIRSTW